ncbi:MAG: GTPase ObgE [Deltaproteobacteria bacterium]|nr:MAG: GTPase ObgE [Deltaproteobacteria bacterium]
MSFVDEAKFFVKAGDGGNGCVSFRREKYVPKGGPNGGDGGRGGDVLLVASSALHSLIDFRYRSHFKAASGEHGQGKNMHGRRGVDCSVEVPVGSLVKDANTGAILCDLTEDGQTFLAATGGEGGLGNVHFKSSTNRTPRIATRGKTGEERWLKIELKLIADVGLVGLPNAGKSTLLSRLSAATPKIAAYPFTTLEPQLGVLQHTFHDPCVIADIPGLVQNAHKGTGLGHTFLRHIERTRILIHVLDASDINIYENFQTIADELYLYREELANRTQILVFNKIDMIAQEDIAVLKNDFAPHNQKMLFVSALRGQGLDELRDLIFEMVGDSGREA